MLPLNPSFIPVTSTMPKVNTNAEDRALRDSIQKMTDLRQAEITINQISSDPIKRGAYGILLNKYRLAGNMRKVIECAKNIYYEPWDLSLELQGILDTCDNNEDLDLIFPELDASTSKYNACKDFAERKFTKGNINDALNAIAKIEFPTWRDPIYFDFFERTDDLKEAESIVDKMNGSTFKKTAYECLRLEYFYKRYKIDEQRIEKKIKELEECEEKKG